MKLKRGFPPIAEETATVLILGSMPGEESLKKNEYYGNPRNSFWNIMASLFDFDFSAPYRERKRILLEKRIALWDVLRSCEREGSLDESINNETIVENDFASFFDRYPNIRNIFFNGAKAEKEYLRRVLPGLSEEKRKINYYRLPSTSPAMNQISLNDKIIKWSKIKKKIDKE